MQPQDRDVRQMLQPFIRHWWVIPVVAGAIAGATYYYYRHQRPTYSATTTVFVRSGGTTPVVGTDPEADPMRRLQNEATLLQTPAVAARVANKLHYQGDPRDLLSWITVTPSTNSDFVSITANTPDRQRSAIVANTFAKAFATLNASQAHALLAAQEASLTNQLAQLPRTIANAGIRANLATELQTLQLADSTPPSIEQVNPATVPSTGTPAPARNAIFGGVLGIVLACLLIQGLEGFDRRLRHPTVEAEYGLPLLASIPFSRGAHTATRSGARVPAPMMEGVRGLRTMLDHGAGSADPPRTVQLTSAVSGEGKSTLIKSLALGYFESARSVLVIDADLRRPMIHELSDAPLAPGLADVLRSAIPFHDAVQQVRPGDLEPAFDRAAIHSDAALAVAPRDAASVASIGGGSSYSNRGSHSAPVLHVLAAGSGTSDPAALLGSEKFTSLLTEVAGYYDVVLIDSPPILAVSDAIPVATRVDAVVVVARSNFTTRDAAQRCRQALQRVKGVNIVGVVANAVRDEAELKRPYYVNAD